MISSKAIFISRRKISLVLFLLILLLPLKAGEFRVAIVGNNDGYNAIAEDVLGLLSGSVDSQKGKDLYLERIKVSNLDSYYDSVKKYLDSESFDKLESLKIKEAEDEELVLKVVYPKFSPAELEYLLSGDVEAARFLRERENLDLLLVFSEVSDQPVANIITYINGSKVREALFADSLRSVELEALIDLLFPLLKDESTRLLAIALPEKSTLYIDGNQVPLYTGYAALKDGKHTLSYIASGYLPKTIEIVVKDGFSSIDLALEEVVPLPIYFSTVPYGARLSYNGEEISSGYIQDGVFPFTVTASYDGFDVYSFQSNKRAENIRIEMKPEWIASSDILSEAKNDFYKSLFYTLVAFGAQIGAETLSGLYPEHNLKPISVVLGGVSLVSLINMLDSAFDYYQAATLGL